MEIEGLPDSVLYLANYYGDKTYLIDTAYREKDDKVIFEGDSLLPAGVYILAGQSNNKILEFLIDGSRKFHFHAALPDIPNNIEFENSPENELFFKYIRKSIEIRKQTEALVKKKSSEPDTTIKHKIQAEIDSLKLSNEVFVESLIEKHPDSFVALVSRSMKEPKPDSIPVLSDGKEDPVFVYQYFKKHYWDNIAVTDSRLLHSPIFNQKVERFFKQVVYQHPDSIKMEIDNFLDKVMSNPDVFKYAVWYLTYKFESSKVMGFDEVFVHMIDNYYTTGKASWVDSTLLKTLENRANDLRNVLIGNFAQDLILIDTAGRFQSLYAINSSYTLVFFYEMGCGHCRTEIELLKNWYNTDSLGLEIFAVNTDTSLTEWKKYIKKKKMLWRHVNGTRSVTPDYHGLYNINTTPSLFLLDGEKRIIAKRLKTKQMREFLENYHANRQPGERFESQ